MAASAAVPMVPLPHAGSSMAPDDAMRDAFQRDGIVVLDDVLQGAALESFRDQVRPSGYCRRVIQRTLSWSLELTAPY